MVALKNVSNVSRFYPALKLNRGLADLNRGSNSLNSISDYLIYLCLVLIDAHKMKKGKPIVIKVLWH